MAQYGLRQQMKSVYVKSNNVKTSIFNVSDALLLILFLLISSMVITLLLNYGESVEKARFLVTYLNKYHSVVSFVFLLY